MMELSGKLERSGSFLLQTAKKLPHAFDAPVQLLFRSGVRQADMFTGSKSFAGNGNHVSLVQQAAGNIACRPDSAAAEKLGNIRINVECALRARAVHSRNSLEPGQDAVAQLNVAAAHFEHAVLRPVECCYRGLLYDRRCI